MDNCREQPIIARSIDEKPSENVQPVDHHCSIHGHNKCTPLKLTPVGMGDPSRTALPDGRVQLSWIKVEPDGSSCTVTTYE